MKDVQRPGSPSTIRRAIDRRGLAIFVAFLATAMLLSCYLLFHAWLRTRTTERGYQLSQLSAEHRALVRERERLQARAGELKSPQRIEELARLRLGMGPAAVDRVVVLVGGALRAGTELAEAR